MNELIFFEKVGTRLKQAREMRNLTLEEAGKQAGVHKSTILRWENGQTEKIKIPIIEALANFYDVNPIWLMGFDIPELNATSVFVYDTITPKTQLGTIESAIDTEVISNAMSKNKKQYFALKIKDDSMEPYYLNGDIIIFEKKDNFENGDDCCIMVTGIGSTFKRLYKTENGIVVQSLNPKYQPLSFSDKQISNSDIKVLGVFAELRRRK